MTWDIMKKVHHAKPDRREKFYMAIDADYRTYSLNPTARKDPIRKPGNDEALVDDVQFYNFRWSVEELINYTPIALQDAVDVEVVVQKSDWWSHLR